MVCLRRTGIALLLTLGLAAPGEGQPGAPDCTSPDHRAFDFWVGEWDVYDASGRLVAENIISLEMNDCVIHESYTNRQGYHGESFNVFDRTRGVWHQTWVDQNGALLRLEGGLRGGDKVLGGATLRPDGTEALNRITWTPADDGSVRQLWEATVDGGTSWTTVFDGTYRRR